MLLIPTVLFITLFTANYNCFPLEPNNGVQSCEKTCPNLDQQNKNCTCHNINDLVTKTIQEPQQSVLTKREIGTVPQNLKELVAQIRANSQNIMAQNSITNRKKTTTRPLVARITTRRRSRFSPRTTRRSVTKRTTISPLKMSINERLKAVHDKLENIPNLKQRFGETDKFHTKDSVVGAAAPKSTTTKEEEKVSNPTVKETSKTTEVPPSSLATPAKREISTTSSTTPTPTSTTTLSSTSKHSEKTQLSSTPTTVMKFVSLTPPKKPDTKVKKAIEQIKEKREQIKEKRTENVQKLQTRTGASTGTNPIVEKLKEKITLKARNINETNNSKSETRELLLREEQKPKTIKTRTLHEIDTVTTGITHQIEIITQDPRLYDDNEDDDGDNN